MTEQPPEIVQSSAAGKKEETFKGGKPDPANPSPPKETGQSLDENLERLAALNLSSDRSLEPRLSTAMIRLVSALAGVGFLLLIYLMFKLFV